MDIHITAQGIITASAVVAALIALVGLIFKVYDWYKKQNAQDKVIQELSDRHDADMRASKEERTLLVYGVLACLKGLKEQGCNGPVTEAIAKIEKYLNVEAHK